MPLTINGISIDTSRFTTPEAVAQEFVKQAPGKNAKLDGPQLAEALREAFKLTRTTDRLEVRGSVQMAFDGVAVRTLQEGLVKPKSTGATSGSKTEGLRPPPSVPDDLDTTMALLDAPMRNQQTRKLMAGTPLEGELLDTMGFKSAAIDLPALKQQVASATKGAREKLDGLEKERAALLGSDSWKQWLGGDWEVRDAVVLGKGIAAVALSEKGGKPEIHYMDTATNQWVTPPTDLVPKGLRLIPDSRGHILWANVMEGKTFTETPASVLKQVAAHGSIDKHWDKLADIDRQVSALSDELFATALDTEHVERGVTDARLGQAGVPAGSRRQFHMLESHIEDACKQMEALAHELFEPYKTRLRAANDQLDEQQKVPPKPPPSLYRKSMLKIAKEVFTPEDLADPERFATKLTTFKAELQKADATMRKDIGRHFDRRLAEAERRVAEKKFWASTATKEQTVFKFDQGAFRLKNADGTAHKQALLDETDRGGVCLALCTDWVSHGDLPKDPTSGARVITGRHMTFQTAYTFNNLLKTRQRTDRDAELARIQGLDSPSDGEVESLVKLEQRIVELFPADVARSFGAQVRHHGMQAVAGPAALFPVDKNPSGAFQSILKRHGGDGGFIVALTARGEEVEDSGAHAVAVKREGPAIEFFDPNVGAFRFKSEKEFLAWLPTWEQTFYAAQPWETASDVSVAPT